MDGHLGCFQHFAIMEHTALGTRSMASEGDAYFWEPRLLLEYQIP